MPYSYGLTSVSPGSGTGSSLHACHKVLNPEKKHANQGGYRRVENISVRNHLSVLFIACRVRRSCARICWQQRWRWSESTGSAASTTATSAHDHGGQSHHHHDAGEP